jgi:hypothetical protein
MSRPRVVGAVAIWPARLRPVWFVVRCSISRRHRCGGGASTHPAALRLRREHLRPGACGRGCAGAVRGADHRILVYLYAGQFLSKQRTAKALSELFGVPISAGTVAAASSRAARDVAGSGFLDVVRDRIAASPVAHFDETGFRVAGKLHWVHSASTGKYSLTTVHAKRGTVAMNAAGVLPAFTGVAVHNAWAPYDTYAHADHALCGAHVLRELTAVIDSTPTGYCWARQVDDALLGLKKLVDDTVEAGSTFVDPQALADHPSAAVGREYRRRQQPSPPHVSCEEASRAGAASPRPGSRLPALHHRLRCPLR